MSRIAGNEVIDFSKVKIEPLFEDMVDFDTFKCGPHSYKIARRQESGRWVFASFLLSWKTTEKKNAEKTGVYGY